MAPSRVIRIDEEVWAELQRRARPFEDTPNTVLRRALGLQTEIPVNRDSNNDMMDSRVTELLNAVGKSEDRGLTLRSTTTGNFAILSDGGKTLGYIYPQKQRLKVEIRKDWAERAGLKSWGHELIDGWFHTGVSSVYWYVPNGNEEANHSVAKILARLRAL